MTRYDTVLGTGARVFRDSRARMDIWFLWGICLIHLGNSPCGALRRHFSSLGKFLIAICRVKNGAQMLDHGDDHDDGLICQVSWSFLYELSKRERDVHTSWWYLCRPSLKLLLIGNISDVWTSHFHPSYDDILYWLWFLGSDNGLKSNKSRPTHHFMILFYTWYHLHVHILHTTHNTI